MSDPKFRRSFSPASRLKIGFDKVLRTLLMLTVVVMVNYLGAQFFHRFYLSSQTRIALVLPHADHPAFAHEPGDHHAVLRYARPGIIFIQPSSRWRTSITRRTKTSPSAPWTMSATRREAEKVKEQYNLPGEADSPNAPPGERFGHLCLRRPPHRSARRGDCEIPTGADGTG